MTRPFVQRLFLLVYRAAWYPALPVVLAYLWLRGRKDPAYRRHLPERFGAGPGLAGAVWVHAVSLGEMRSAVPLIRALLDRGDTVITSHLTPAGRRAAETAFAPEIAQGRLVVRYLPLEFGWAMRRFLRRWRPRLCLVMEIEVWPVLIEETRVAGVPLYLVNSQYTAHSFARDRRLGAAHPVSGVAGVLAKSDRHAARFRELGAPNVSVCGELRFDQPIPPHLLAAAARLRPLLGGRPVVAIASVVEGEDPQYLAAYRIIQEGFRAKGLVPPLFVHIPRAPERFGTVGDLLAAGGQRVMRRSVVLDGRLSPRTRLPDADILLGDSLGEMYFYLALADLAVVGGGFVEKGAHNIIEPLALRKPVLVGPHVWTIDYPAVEAEAAGVLTICPTIEHLAAEILDLLLQEAKLQDMSGRTQAFFAEHAGATERVLAALPPRVVP
ncbi:3-deoxy-D-manno-octulosonic acid transferase [Halodurantibacterium flavum]|uniref:3-deoxy-D-manno-octulosonic acid transferase n=1 Tax=Halodurantibacterium flavum TaxID=1382802 RepID=A0ABW4S8H2_9RHOB